MFSKTPPGSGSLGGGNIPFNRISARIIEIAFSIMGESFFAGFATDNDTVVPQCWTNRPPFVALSVNSHMIADGHGAISLSVPTPRTPAHRAGGGRLRQRQCAHCELETRSVAHAGRALVTPPTLIDALARNYPPRTPPRGFSISPARRGIKWMWQWKIVCPASAPAFAPTLNPDTAASALLILILSDSRSACAALRSG